MTYLSKRFWRETAERAIKTVAQTAVALVPTSAVVIDGVDWGLVAGGASLAGVLSVLTSIGSRRIGVDEGSPSVV